MNHLSYNFTRSFLSQILEEAHRQNNLLHAKSFSRILALLDNLSLDTHDLRLKELMIDIGNFKEGKIDENHLARNIVWYMENYGNKLKEIGYSEASEYFDTQIKARIAEFSEQGQVFNQVDFTEIPPGNKADGNQDTFEMFARDFLEGLGYEIKEDPGRGADDGKDLVVVETMEGIKYKDELRWLVSCKHFAHSEKSVGTNDEKNISDRVGSAKCHGFMAFYSTKASASLIRRFEGVRNHRSNPYPVFLFDGEKITQHLIKEKTLWPVCARYLPESYKKPFIAEIQRQFELSILKAKLDEEHHLRNAAARLDASRVQQTQWKAKKDKILIEKYREHQLKRFHVEEE